MEWLHIYKEKQHLSKTLIADLGVLAKKDKHSVILLGSVCTDLPEGTEVLKDSRTGRKTLFARMKTADRIVWHGFDWGPKIVVPLWTKRQLLKKSIWHISYGDTVHLPYHNQKLPKKLYFRIKDSVRNAMSAYATDSWGDFYRIKNEFGSEKPVFLTGSTFDREFATYLKSLEHTEKAEETVHILVGNGSYPSMQHAKVLKLLARFMYEDIQVHLPLYGFGANQAYAERMRSLARGYFGPKVKFYDHELSAEEYVALLNKVDVGIYFSGVHNALRDILALRYLGKKVYCADSIRTQYQLAEVESRLGRIASIPECSISSFANYVEKIPTEEYEALLNAAIEEQMLTAVQEAEAARNEQDEAAMVASDTAAPLTDTAAEELPLPEIPKFRVIFPEVDREKVFRAIASFDQSAGWNELIRYLSKKAAHPKDERIKYLHLIPPRHNIIYPFMEMSQKFFPSGEHQFLVTTPHLSYAPKLIAQPYTEFEMGRTRRARLKHMFTRLRAADHVVFHSLYISKLEAFAIALSPSILKKSAWIEWGKDLYDYKLPATSLANRFMNLIHTRIRKNISCYVSIFEPDAEKFREQFSNSTPILQTSYTAYNSIEMLERTRPTAEEIEVEGERPLHIQVGHSCNIWGNHKQVLNSLAMYKFEDILLKIPLSTGAPPSNKKAISSFAKTLFDSKAQFLWNELDKEDYFRFLWSVDVAVFGLYRQAALGNIIRLLYMGKKVYLPKDSVMYNFFVDHGVEIYDTESIAATSFEEFSAPLKTPAPNPFILKMLNEADLVDTWRNVFAQIEEIVKKK